MKKSVLAGLILCAAAGALTVFNWAGPPKMPFYRGEELAELTCDALGERHDEVIFDYHDIEVAHFRQTGAFHDDLGIPSEDVVPYAVLIKHFLHNNNISEADIVSTSSSTLILDSGFYYEVSRICATNPSWQATDAMLQAAQNLGLIGR